VFFECFGCITEASLGTKIDNLPLQNEGASILGHFGKISERMKTFASSSISNHLLLNDD